MGNLVERLGRKSNEKQEAPQVQERTRESYRQEYRWATRQQREKMKNAAQGMPWFKGIYDGL
jgi:hypothetical protein